ncbi:ABC transporter substrate-binding protein [Pantoea agglomerans]|uniref:ABC transporter substrate-binding protein n=1 Tax=Enterobacter agglomerans TaxID=549 RepID=UPI0037C613D6
MMKRTIWLSLLAALCMVFGSASAWATITVTDMLQRKVTLPGPASRIVLGESRHIITLALLEKDPISNVVGWGDDLQRYSPATWEAIAKQYPAARNIPVMGTMNSGTFSMEATIAAKPDLVIFTLYGPIPPDLKALDAAHIPYVFVDFFRKPLENTVPSLKLLGAVLGVEPQAGEVIAFWQQHMDEVKKRLASVSTRPSVFFHLNPGKGDCCFTSGPSNMSDFIAAAGGHNIGADMLSAPIGKLNPEYVLTRNPDFYLMGGGSAVSRDGLQIGTGATPEQVAQSSKHLLNAPEIANLQAVAAGHAGGVWLFFFDSPLYFVGIEAMAKMFHPALFADVDPDATLHTVTSKWLSIPLKGTFWTALPGK